MKTRLKLTNVVDKVLVDRGLLSPKCVRSCEVEGRVDEQIPGLVIPAKVAQSLGLRVREQFVNWNFQGEDQIGVSEPFVIEYETRHTTLEAVVAGSEVRIGRILLDLLNLPANENRPEIKTTTRY